MVLAQYYNLVRFGREGYGYVMRSMEKNARALAEKLAAMGDFELIGADAEQLPLVAFKLSGDLPYDEFDVSWQLSAERGWMLPAYTLPPNAQEVKVLRALVKLTLSRERIDHLAVDIEEALETLERKGGADPAEREKVQIGPGH
jgi:glutamate decarboxylase